MKKLRWPKLSIAFWERLAAVVAVVALLVFRLGSQPNGLAANETVLPSVKASLSTLWNNPLQPLETLSRLVVAILAPTSGMTVSRLPSAILGLAMIVLMFWLLKRWYGHRLAIYGSLLTATAVWFLHVSRLATADISWPLAMVAILALSSLWHGRERPGWLLYATAAALALSLYIPGMIWLVVVVLILERANFKHDIRQRRKATVWSAGLIVAMLVPLGHYLISNWASGKALLSILGIPTVWPGVLSGLKGLALVWPHIFIAGYYNPVYNLGNLPVVDVLITICFGAGVYLYAQHPSASRSKLLLALWLVGTVIVGLGTVHLSLLLPLVMVAATGGLGYILHFWLKVFPRNPLARGLGIGLIGLLIATSVVYSVRNYFVAWPNTPATRAAFQERH